MSTINQARKAAAEFMRHKGYGDAQPVLIEEDEDDYIWYFFYELDEGTLELEVEWSGSKWFWDVIDFVHYQDEGETLAMSSR